MPPLKMQVTERKSWEPLNIFPILKVVQSRTKKNKALG